MKIYERLSRVYDLGWTKFTENYPRLITQLIDEFGIKNARILDIACGTGELAMALSKQGISIVGIDISPEMIAIAKAKSTDLNNISFDVQNMSDFSVPGKFNVITCTFDALNYLIDPEDLKAMIKFVARSLIRSGLFIFDSNTHHHYATLRDGSSDQQMAGESFIQEWTYDPAQESATTTFRFADGAMEIHKQRPYDLSDLSPLMSDSGLRVVRAMSSFDGRPYDDNSNRLFCIVQKN